ALDAAALAAAGAAPARGDLTASLDAIALAGAATSEPAAAGAASLQLAAASLAATAARRPKRHPAALLAA
ncbi:MAG: hypothetical protein ABSC22_17300, partial [Roseiarcus sp.]